MRKKGKRLWVCPLCGFSGEGAYWQIGEWDVCEPCGEKYYEGFYGSDRYFKFDPDIEGYVRERVGKA